MFTALAAPQVGGGGKPVQQHNGTTLAHVHVRHLPGGDPDALSLQGKGHPLLLRGARVMASTTRTTRTIAFTS